MVVLLVQREFAGEVSVTGGKCWPELHFWFASRGRKEAEGARSKTLAVSSTPGEEYLASQVVAWVKAWRQCASNMAPVHGMAMAPKLYRKKTPTLR